MFFTNTFLHFIMFHFYFFELGLLVGLLLLRENNEKFDSTIVYRRSKSIFQFCSFIFLSDFRCLGCRLSAELIGNCFLNDF